MGHVANVHFPPIADIGDPAQASRQSLLMRPFLTSKELQFFIGDTISQVSLNPCAVLFSFESKRRLVTEQRIEHFEPNGSVWPYDPHQAEKNPLMLHRLLYRSIVRITTEEARLTLLMDDGSALAVVMEPRPYESGYIEAPEIGFCVF